MKTVFHFIVIALFFMSSHLFAAEISAKEKCNQEAAKVPINKALLETVCLQAAKKAEADKNYGNASWFYLLAGKIDYILSEIERHINPKTSIAIYSNIGHAYTLISDSQNAEKHYQQFLKVARLTWANSAMQDDYNILMQLVRPAWA